MDKKKSSILDFCKFLIEDKIEAGDNEDCCKIKKELNKKDQKSIIIKKSSNRIERKLSTPAQIPTLRKSFRDYIRNMFLSNREICPCCNKPKKKTDPTKEVEEKEELTDVQQKINEEECIMNIEDTRNDKKKLFCPAYFYFIQEVHSRKRKGNFGIKFDSLDEMATCIAEVWQQMSMDQKKPYYAKMKEAALKDKNDWVQHEIEKELNDVLSDEYKNHQKRMRSRNYSSK